MNDHLLLSLHLDGRLASADRARLEERLRKEPALRQRLEKLQALQRLSAALPTTQAAFTADQVRARPPVNLRGWSVRGLAAAAAILLLTHAAAFWFGRGDTPPTEVALTLAEAEALLRRAAELGPAMPYEKLNGQLIDLRSGIHRTDLARRLDDLQRHRLTDSERRQLNRVRDTMAQWELAFENMRDPGFLSVVVSATARRHLGNGSFPRALPTGARFYASTSKIGNDRYKLVFINLEGDAPVIQEDEGTLEELRQKHEGITFIRNK